VSVARAQIQYAVDLYKAKLVEAEPEER
jgi:hypothetical protein